MEKQREKLRDYLEGIAAAHKNQILIIGTILAEDGNREQIHEELKCFGYQSEGIYVAGAREQIIKTEELLEAGLKIAFEFRDGTENLFMASLKRIIDSKDENVGNNKSAILLILNQDQYDRLNNSEIVHSVCNLA